MHSAGLATETKNRSFVSAAAMQAAEPAVAGLLLVPVELEQTKTFVGWKVAAYSCLGYYGFANQLNRYPPEKTMKMMYGGQLVAAVIAAAAAAFVGDVGVVKEAYNL